MDTFAETFGPRSSPHRLQKRSLSNHAVVRDGTLFHVIFEEEGAPEPTSKRDISRRRKSASLGNDRNNRHILRVQAVSGSPLSIVRQTEPICARKIHKVEKINALLFTNGNLAIYSHSKRGYGFGRLLGQEVKHNRTSVDSRRVFALGNCRVKAITQKKDKFFMDGFEIIPREHQYQSMVLASHSSTIIQKWLKDIVSIASMEWDDSKLSYARLGQSATMHKLGPSIIEIKRAKEAWAHAFFGLGGSASEVPHRYWNFELDISENHLKQFRLWRDFRAFAIDLMRENAPEISTFYSEAVSDNEWEAKESEDNVRNRITFTKIDNGKVPISDARIGDAIQIFSNAYAVSLVVCQADEDILPYRVSASLQTTQDNHVSFIASTGRSLFHSNHTDGHISYIDMFRGIFNRSVSSMHKRFKQVTRIDTNGQVNFIGAPFKTSTAARFIRTLFGNDTDTPYKYNVEVKMSCNFHYLQSRKNFKTEAMDGIFFSKNEIVSQILGKDVFGSVIVETPFDDQVDKEIRQVFQESTKLRPEYPSCNFGLFLWYTQCLHRLECENNSFGHPQKEICEMTLSNDIDSRVPLVTAQRALRYKSLITRPQQLITMVHQHGGDYSLPVISALRNYLPEALRRIIYTDYLLLSCDGHLIMAATHLAAHFLQSDLSKDWQEQLKEAKKAIILAWIRITGHVVPTSSLIDDDTHLQMSPPFDNPEAQGNDGNEGGKSSAGSYEENLFQVSSLGKIVDHTDKNFQGPLNSLSSCGSDEAHVMRLARGSNVFPIRESHGPDDHPNFSIEPNDSILLSAALLNRSLHFLSRDAQNPVRKLGFNIGHEPILYSSTVKFIFQNEASTAFRQKMSSSERHESSDSPASRNHIETVIHRSGEKWWDETIQRPQTSACAFAWLQVAMDRVHNCDDNFISQTACDCVLDGIDNAEQFLDSYNSMALIPCIFVRSVFSSNKSYTVLALKLTLEPLSSIVSPTWSKLLIKWLLNLADTKRSQSEYLELYKSAKFLISTPNVDISRHQLIEEILLDDKSMGRLLTCQYADLKREDLNLGNALRQYLQHSPYAMDTLDGTPSQFSQIFSVASAIRSIKKQSAEMSSSGIDKNSNTMKIHGKCDANLLSLDSIAASRSKESPFDGNQDDYSSVAVLGPICGLSEYEESMIFSSVQDKSHKSVDNGIAHQNEDLMPTATKAITRLWEESKRFLDRHLIVVTKISCGQHHSAIVTSNGVLLTFGQGGGLLGHGSLSSRGQPTVVAYFASRKIIVNSVACGSKHTVALCTEPTSHSGIAYAWGWGEAGRLGQGIELGVEPQPLRINRFLERHQKASDNTFTTNDLSAEVNPIASVACGYEHTIFLSTTGKLYTCGAGDFGRLGLGTENNQLAPMRVSKNIEEEYMIDIAAGDLHSLAVSRDGVAYSWGFGEYGALGHGNTTNQLAPKRLEILQDFCQVRQVCCKSSHSIAVDTKRRVWIWGRGPFKNTDCQSPEDCPDDSTPSLVHLFTDSETALEVETLICGPHVSVAMDSQNRAFLLNLQTGQADHLFQDCSGSVKIGVGSYHLVAAFSKRIQSTNSACAKEAPIMEPIPRLPRLDTMTEEQFSEFVDDDSDTDAQTTASGSAVEILYSHEYDSCKDINKEIDIDETISRVFFCGTLDANAIQFYSSFSFLHQRQEIELFNLGFFDENYQKLIPPISTPCHQPIHLFELDGQTITSAAGSAECWQMLTDEGIVYRLRLDRAENERLERVSDFDVCGRVHQIYGGNSGHWQAALVSKDRHLTLRSTRRSSYNSLNFDDSSLSPATNVVFWRHTPINQKDVLKNSEVDPPLVWPNREDVQLASVATGRDQILALDTDGSVFQFKPNKHTCFPRENFSHDKMLKRSNGLEEFRQRVYNFYRKYSPSKIRTNSSFVENICNIYKANQEKLIGELTEKYGPEPTDCELRSPISFLKNYPTILRLPSKSDRILQVACGDKHTLLLTDRGVVLELNEGYLGAQGTEWSIHQATATTTEEKGRHSEQQKPYIIHDFPKLQNAMISTVSCGHTHSLALSFDGRLFSWGDGSWGQLGHGNRNGISTPNLIEFFSLNTPELRVSKIACGWRHSAIVTTDGKAYTWGFSETGALGLGQKTNNENPHKTLDQEFESAKVLPREVKIKSYSFKNVFAHGTSTLLITAAKLNKQ